MTTTALLFYGLLMVIFLLMALIVWCGLSIVQANSFEGRTTHSKTIKDNQLLTTNVRIFKERLAELEKDFAAQQVSAEEFQEQKRELERQLLSASKDLQNSQKTAETTLGYVPKVLLITGIVGLSSVVYASLTQTQASHFHNNSVAASKKAVDKSRQTVKYRWQNHHDYQILAHDLLSEKINELPKDFFDDANTVADKEQKLQNVLQVLQAEVHRHAHQQNYWINIAEIYKQLGLTEQAMFAYEKALHLGTANSVKNNKLILTYARTSFEANQGKLSTSAQRHLTKLLSSNPNHEGAQMLILMHFMAEKDMTQAVYWVNQLEKSMLAKSANGSQSRTNALERIKQLKQLVLQKTSPPQT